MNDNKQTRLVLVVLTATFAMLAVAFSLDLFGKFHPVREIPLVDRELLKTETWRRSYANLVSAKAELDDFDCYTCHEKGKKPVLKYDAKQQLIIPLSLIHI